MSGVEHPVECRAHFTTLRDMLFLISHYGFSLFFFSFFYI